jgi:uncharacterized damage-inducible protein DinB
MAELDEQGRPLPEPAVGEVATLLGYLDFQRATLAWKCSRLDAAGLRATTATSSLTLGGILKHMAWVEDWWFSQWLHGNAPAPPWDTLDETSDPDWEFNSAAGDSPDELRGLWQGAVDRSRTLVAEALAAGGMDHLAKRTWKSGESPSLRWIVVHMIEEYARHNGHADLLRESVDGETGE